MTDLAPSHAPPRVEPAEFRKDVFSCTACGVCAPHHWHQLTYSRGNRTNQTRVWRAACAQCDAESFWSNDGRRLDPDAGGGPPPNPDMPDEIRVDYLEAASIVDRSPRGACGLLRLATERLVLDIGDGRRNMRTNIKKLAEDGTLPESVIKAMHVLRVVGNHAVHPNALDLGDHETALSLFELVNLIVEETYSKQKRLEAIYGRLPEAARKDIES